MLMTTKRFFFFSGGGKAYHVSSCLLLQKPEMCHNITCRRFQGSVLWYILSVFKVTQQHDCVGLLSGLRGTSSLINMHTGTRWFMSSMPCPVGLASLTSYEGILTLNSINQTAHKESEWSRCCAYIQCKRFHASVPTPKQRSRKGYINLLL